MARKTKEDTLKTVEAILDAAEKVFMEKGVAATTVADIADRAGLSRGAIYGHYKDKIAVCVAMCERANATTASITTRQDGEPPLHTLHRWGINYLRLIHESSTLKNALTVLYVKCEQTPEYAALQRIKTLWERRTSFASLGLLRKAIDAGELPADLDLDLGNNHILAVVEGISGTLWCSNRLGTDVWPKIDRLLSAAIDSLKDSLHLRKRPAGA